MSEQEKKNWVEFFLDNPAYIVSVAKAANHRPFLVRTSHYWHDLVNVLTPIYANYKGGL